MHAKGGRSRKTGPLSPLDILHASACAAGHAMVCLSRPAGAVPSSFPLPPYGVIGGELYRTPKLRAASRALWDRATTGCFTRRCAWSWSTRWTGFPLHPRLAYLSTLPRAVLPAQNPACAWPRLGSPHEISVRISFLLHSPIKSIKVMHSIRHRFSRIQRVIHHRENWPKSGPSAD